MTASKIEWTDEVWNPVTGCDHVSAGCDNCYAERIATRFGRPFLGAVELHPERLDAPLRWRRPRRVFVNSVSDLFHRDVPFDFVVDVFAVMAAASEHTFQILTKRPQRMATFMRAEWPRERIAGRAVQRSGGSVPFAWPLPNVWLGVSVENQRYADLRIPHLLATPAAVRFLSVEPLLGPVDISRWLGVEYSEIAECWSPEVFAEMRAAHGIIDPRPDWVIAGGESGPGARPMSPWWPRSIRDQCEAAGVPFFFKQHGEFAPAVDVDPALLERRDEILVDGEYVCRVGKKAAGRLLDGREWNEYPA